MNETLYRKRGRRYVPCSEYELPGGVWPYGTHISVVQPGMSITRYQIKPDTAGLLAVLYTNRDQIIAALHKMTEARVPSHIELTEKQAQVWRHWQEVCGHMYAVQTPAVADAFDAIVAHIEGTQAAPEKVES